MGNPVTWFEIHGPESEHTAKFYSELFGWHIDAMPEANYNLIDTHSGRGINGGIGQTREGQPPHSVFYAENPDIQALLDKAESLGGKTVVPVTEIPDMVTFAHFTDPWGNLIGLVMGEGKSRVSPGDNPPVDWFELQSSEPQKAWDFYRTLFGWEIKESQGEGPAHGEIDAGSGIHGGIGGSPDGQPYVTMYALVDDLQKYLERSEALGGTTVMPPMEVGEGTSIAVLRDPQGTMFGLYTRSH